MGGGADDDGTCAGGVEKGMRGRFSFAAVSREVKGEREEVWPWGITTALPNQINYDRLQ